jgi:PKD repeat protein
MTARKMFGVLVAISSALTLAGCGGGDTGGSGGGVVGPTGDPPSAAFTVSASTALASVTEVAFTASTGGLASYDWDFGDGTTATGQTVRKTYASAGSFPATLRVTDSRGTASNSSSTVVVKPLDALWDDDAQEYGVKMTQEGTSFHGRTVFRVRGLTGATTGSVDNTLHVTYSTSYGAGVSDSFQGRLDPDLDHITGKLTLNIFGLQFPFNMNFVRK